MLIVRRSFTQANMRFCFRNKIIENLQKNHWEAAAHRSAFPCSAWERDMLSMGTRKEIK